MNAAFTWLKASSCQMTTLQYDTPSNHRNDTNALFCWLNQVACLVSGGDQDYT